MELMVFLSRLQAICASIRNLFAKDNHYAQYSPELSPVRDTTGDVKDRSRP